jgi:hypothetical protein
MALPFFFVFARMEVDKKMHCTLEGMSWRESGRTKENESGGI